MFCPFCGKPVTQSDALCPNCGRDLVSERTDVPHASAAPPSEPGGTFTPSQAPAPTQTPTPAAPLTQQATNPAAQTSPVTPLGENGRITSEQSKQIVSEAEKSGIGMNWYKFITFVSLIGGSVVLFAAGISFLTGLTYKSEGLSAEYVYASFPTLKGVDSISGLACLATIGLYIYTFTLMKRLSKQGPKFVNICYITYTSINVFHVLGVASVLKAPPGTYAGIIGPIVSCVVWILINNKYFGNRAHLFQYE